SNTSKLLVRGEIGNRMEYKVIDDQNDFLGNLLESNELDELSPVVLPPEAVSADLRQRYRRKGYDDVVISGPEEETHGDTTVFTFKVLAGPQYQIESISFQGNSAISDQSLREMIGIDSFWRSEPLLNVRQIENG